MTKQEKNELIGILKEKFGQYNNFYVTNTESLTVEQIGKLRRACYSKNVEMKVAKNTLIRKAMEQLDATRYQGAFESLNGVTALMFSDNAKEPALILTSFRKDINEPKPILKAAFIDGEIFIGDDKLAALKALKSKKELVGEVIGLLQSPAKRVLAGLLHHHEKQAAAAE
jgi:large subunit ribosomal protein L10